MDAPSENAALVKGGIPLNLYIIYHFSRNVNIYIPPKKCFLFGVDSIGKTFLNRNSFLFGSVL